MVFFRVSKKFKGFWIRFISSFVFFILSYTNSFAANVTINLVVVNASATEAKKTPITYFLPKELTSEDIINTGGLNLEYDVDKSSYYVQGEVELAPKESRTLKIEVKDVWRISAEEVELLKKQIDDNLAYFKNTPYYESGKILRDRMAEKLDYILAQQSFYTENIERRIEEYRAHLEQLNAIRKDAFSTEYLKTTPTETSADQTVKFIIEVKNPSDKETKKVKQKHYLPLEVRSEHVIDAQGFEIRFDEKKGQSFLEKEEEFKPGESKRYEIIIQDIWHIPQSSVEDLKKRAEIAFEGVKGSEYEKGAKFLYDIIVENMEKIELSTAEKSNMKKYIGAFRSHKQLFKESEESIIKLEQMLAAVKAKKLEELESSKVKNILQKLQALRGIMAISQAVFGKRPTITNTWIVIWGVLAFVALFTAIHFFTWWRKSQVMGEEMAIKAGRVIKEVTPPQPEVEKK